MPCRRSYEAYLQSFVTEADLRYLPNAATALRVVELGCAQAAVRPLWWPQACDLPCLPPCPHQLHAQQGWASCFHIPPARSHLHGEGELLQQEEWEACKAALAARRDGEAHPRPKALLSAGRWGR